MFAVLENLLGVQLLESFWSEDIFWSKVFEIANEIVDRPIHLVSKNIQALVLEKCQVLVVVGQVGEQIVEVFAWVLGRVLVAVSGVSR